MCKLIWELVNILEKYFCVILGKSRVGIGRKFRKWNENLKLKKEK